MASLPLPARFVLTHLVGYFRWTQTLPMLLAWATIWAILAAFVFVNFQTETLTLLSALEQLAERFPRLAASLPDVGPLGQDQADGSVTFGDEDIRRIVLTYWGLVSALLYLLSLAWQRMVSPRPRRGLLARFRLAAISSAVTFVALLVVYATSSQPFHGSLATWVMVFLALSLLPLGVSLYALTIGWVCELMVQGINSDSVVVTNPQSAPSAP
jgi:uncharacterized membrane protein